MAPMKKYREQENELNEEGRHIKQRGQKQRASQKKTRRRRRKEQ